MQMQFSVIPTQNFVVPPQKPLPMFFQTPQIRDRFIQPSQNDSLGIAKGNAIISRETQQAQIYAGFFNMFERAKPNNLPCGSCGSR